MKLLAVELDRKSFVDGTTSRVRVERFSQLADEVHVLVYSLRDVHDIAPMQVAKNVWLYPTHSRTKLHYIPDMVRIGKSIPDVDVVTSQDPWECGVSAWLIARHHKATWQVHVRTDPYSTYFQQESFRNKYIYDMLFRFLVPKADGILFVSERARKNVLAKNITIPKQQTILPSYVDSSYFSQTVLPTTSPELSRFSHIVQITSRFTVEKDIPTSLDAFSLVLQEYPDAGLLLIGEGYPDITQKIQEHITALGIQNNVVYLPWQKDIRPFLARSDVFLLTSTYEGCARAILEAVFAGVPVVTTEQGIIGSVLQHERDVLACPVGDAECVADCIKQTIAEPQTANMRTEHAKKQLMDMLPNSYEEYVRGYRKVLEEL
jgi:glycosyltransferase involved in cell wall biosynthesis